MRCTLAHDYLTQLGGAERVALGLTKIFPGSPLFTAVYEQSQTFPQFQDVDVRTSSLQRVRAFRKDPRLALPMLSRAWQEFLIDDTDAVLISSSGWAHSVRVQPGIRKVVYCHNPPRWLYQGSDYLRRPVERAAISMLGAGLRRRDQLAAGTADAYIANSSVVAGRIQSTYGIKPLVIHPPVDVDVYGPQQPVEGLEPGFWLTISRNRGYKNTEPVIEAVTRLLGQRLVVAGGSVQHREGAANPLLHELGRVSDESLRWLYGNCRGLITMANEDFGLTPIEANAFGKPAITIRAGGFLDSVAPGVSGAFIQDATAESAATTLADLPDFDPRRIAEHARDFSMANFARRIRYVVGTDTPVPAGLKIPRQVTLGAAVPGLVSRNR